MANDKANQWSRVNRNHKMYDQYPAQEPPRPPKPNGPKGSGPRKPRKTKKKRRWILAIFLWLFTLGVIAGLAGTALFFTYANDAPNITESDLASENSTQLLDSKGNVFWSMATQDRDYANSNEIPKQLKQAVVSIEDRRFYKHHGVDPIRIAGAAISNIKGSSLGMQG